MCAVEVTTMENIVNVKCFLENINLLYWFFFFFSSRRRHTRWNCDWSSDVCSSDLFGKALVQSVYRISSNAGLALTTAHYYTPSGRLIQRPWDATFDEYLSYSLRDQDPNKPHNASDLKHTDSGRAVYSGGGIEPDKRVSGPLEGFNPGRFGRLLYGRGEFENYAQKFAAEGDTRVTGRSTGRKTVARDFTVDDAMVADFRDQLATDKVKI